MSLLRINASRCKTIPHCGRNGLRLLRDSDEKLIMREHREFPVFPIALNTISSEGQPVRQSKIDGLV